MLEQDYRVLQMVCNCVVFLLSSIPLQLYTTEATRVMNTELNHKQWELCIFTHLN